MGIGTQLQAKSSHYTLQICALCNVHCTCSAYICFFNGFATTIVSPTCVLLEDETERLEHGLSLDRRHDIDQLFLRNQFFRPVVGDGVGAVPPEEGS